MEKERILIIGGGPAGLEAAYNLAENNYAVTIFEKDTEIGGNIKKWVKLFPDFGDAAEVRKNFKDKVTRQDIDIKTDISINELYSENGKWFAKNSSGNVYEGNAALLATGFETFNASRKEELGYGIYNNVITSVEFEQMYKTGKIITAEGKTPERIAFLNCVGSRDEKVGNHYCSRICCINAVKQAIEFKELVPDAEAYCFYMDMRMAGQFYEELYRKSQEKFGVTYIRGRISEAAGTIDNRIQIKSEDTLTGLPLKMTVDLLVLMVGIESSDSTTALAKQNEINGEYGFAKSVGLHGSDNLTKKEGLFLAGSCKRPLTLPETIADGRAAAIQIIEFLKLKVKN
ncbi:MAG: FAD-dependent oxidoreductase [Bacteroidales bacterium]|jgi:heterodisulfide reductase subunit A|nr:FAD-dependent oxidoreductase [Bacteroidales bacterium]